MWVWVACVYFPHILFMLAFRVYCDRRVAPNSVAFHICESVDVRRAEWASGVGCWFFDGLSILTSHLQLDAPTRQVWGHTITLQNEICKSPKRNGGPGHTPMRWHVVKSIIYILSGFVNSWDEINSQCFQFAHFSVILRIHSENLTHCHRYNMMCEPNNCRKFNNIESQANDSQRHDSSIQTNNIKRRLKQLASPSTS